MPKKNTHPFDADQEFFASRVKQVGPEPVPAKPGSVEELLKDIELQNYRGRLYLNIRNRNPDSFTQFDLGPVMTDEAFGVTEWFMRKQQWLHRPDAPLPDPPTPPGKSQVAPKDPRFPKRSANYHLMSLREQWDEDKRNGYLDM